MIAIYLNGKCFINNAIDIDRINLGLNFTSNDEAAKAIEILEQVYPPGSLSIDHNYVVTEKELQDDLVLQDILAKLEDKQDSVWYKEVIEDLIAEIRCIRDNIAGRQSG